MSKLQIVTCFPLNSEQAELIQNAVSGVNVLVSSQERIADDLMQADIFCGHAKVPVDWEKVVSQGRLKWIQSSAAGLDHCLTQPVIDSDVVVSGCSGLFAPQVAEQTLALLFSVVRSMRVFHAQQETREFVRRPTGDFHGKTVGILGLGGNGLATAKVLRAMAGRIIGTDLFSSSLIEQQESLPASERCSAAIGCVDEIHPPERTGDVLARSDVVVVTLPLTPDTRGYLSAERFALIKPDAIFVNVGRGQLVNHDDLVASLQEGRLSAAALDVTEPEPLPQDSPLWSMGNVVITPHVGAQSSRRVPSTIELIVANLQRWQQDLPLLNLVDKSLGFPRPEHRLPENTLRSFLESASNSN